MWGVPRRNPLFVGRERELALLDQRLAAEPAPEAAEGELVLSEAARGRQAMAQRVKRRRRATPSGITQLEAMGIGGVGKTQLAVEYCHRSYPSRYSLIIWLRAESPELIAEDLRRLAADVGIDVAVKESQEIYTEIRTRLYNAKCPWLVVVRASTPRARTEERREMKRGEERRGG